MPTFIRDDSGYKRDNGLAAWGLLVIPLFLLLVGLGAYNLYTSSKTGQTSTTQSNGQNGLQFGVGGSAPTATPRATRTPTPSLSPTPRSTSSTEDASGTSGQQLGVGGGPTTPTPTIDYSDSPQVPAGAPQTGAGGSQ